MRRGTPNPVHVVLSQCGCGFANYIAVMKRALSSSDEASTHEREPLRPRNGRLRMLLTKSGRANWSVTAKPSLGWTASRRSWQASG